MSVMAILRQLFDLTSDHSCIQKCHPKKREYESGDHSKRERQNQPE